MPVGRQTQTPRRRRAGSSGWPGWCTAAVTGCWAGGSRCGGRAGDAGVLRLTTTGRRTGDPPRHRRLPGGRPEPGHAGDERVGPGEPAWWLNLQSRPEADADLVDGHRLVHARAATGDERTRLRPLARNRQEPRRLRRAPSVADGGGVLEPRGGRAAGRRAQADRTGDPRAG
ncbi:nitroreductase/quinone reductase family protein [Streptomyces sp. KL116D]|uniref:nitroreductase/quinone reductase family protein n=1 Tax=Streptomyces sp. KL116D TaxID=3045152 RepID=UPI003557885D